MKLVIFVVCAIVSFAPCIFGQNKVHIGVYYESLCPDSLRFIKNQLNPNYWPFASYIDVALVPFGKAKQVDSGSEFVFECQHGPDECQGNKIHSCALYHALSQGAQVNFTACQMQHGIEDVELCAKGASLSYERVMECVSSDLGIVLQLNAEMRTKEIASPREMLSFVPTIVYNHHFDQDKQNRSLYKFREVLCDEIKAISKNIPAVCTKKKF